MNKLTIKIRQRQGRDRGRFCVLTLFFYCAIILGVMLYAKTSEKEKRKRNLSCNAQRYKPTANF